MKIKDLTLIALMVAFISVSAQIAIPLGAVPFTMQTTLILMSGLILGSKRGFLTCIVYILVGAVGFPVFAHFKGGIGILFLQTGGFIISFPIMAYVVGKFSEVFDNKAMTYLGAFIGVVINFVVGCAYFMFVTKMDLITSLTYTVFPFVITSGIQIVLAVYLSDRIKRFNFI